MSIKSIAAGLLITLGLAGASQAAVVLTPSPVQISWTLVYADASDFNIDISASPATCKGFTLSSNSPTFKETMALIMLAKAKSRPVMVWMDDAVKNTSGYCKLFAISVQ